MSVKSQIAAAAKRVIHAYYTNHPARLDPCGEPKLALSDFNKLKVHYRVPLRWRPSKKYKRIDNVIRAGRVVLALGQLGTGIAGLPTGITPEGAPELSNRGGGALGMDAGMMVSVLEGAHKLVSPSYRQHKKELHANENYKIVKAGKFLLYGFAVFEFTKATLPSPWPGTRYNSRQAVGRMFQVTVGLNDTARHIWPNPHTATQSLGCFSTTGDPADVAAWVDKNNYRVYVGNSPPNGPQMVPLAWQDVA